MIKLLESTLRTDILDPDLVKTPEGIKVIVEQQFNHLVQEAIPDERSKTPGAAKNIIETLELIRTAILEYEARAHTTEDGKIDVVFEDPDKDLEVETISLQFNDRIAGSFAQGGIREGSVKNRRPIMREILDDPDNPGYKRVVLGYFFDNTVTMTCWARTNKQANARALWLESLMQEYTWFFRFSGVNRILYDKWQKPKTIQVNNNRYYGRPIDYFVRTEKIVNVSQKTLEEICIRVAMRSTMT